MSAKHTQGPWTCSPALRIGGKSVQFFDINAPTLPTHIAKVALRTDGAGIANARLIAAAPDTAAERDRLREVNARLVEALKMMMETHAMHWPCRHRSCDDCQRAYTQARAALATAKRDFLSPVNKMCLTADESGVSLNLGTPPQESRGE